MFLTDASTTKTGQEAKIFLEDSQILQAMADRLKQPVGNLSAYWTDITSQAHAKAYNTIVRTLIARGYLLAQITAWDDGAEFEQDLSIYWSFVEGAGTHDFDPAFIRMLDRREELKTIILSIGGAQVSPNQQQVGTVNFGRQQVIHPHNIHW